MGGGGGGGGKGEPTTCHKSLTNYQATDSFERKLWVGCSLYGDLEDVFGVSQECLIGASVGHCLLEDTTGKRI